jgi:hypothetical protein
MTNNELQQKIESSANMTALRDRIGQELSNSVPNTVSFDPMLVIMLISVVVQVIQFCHQQRSAEDIKQDIKDIRTLPPRKLMRLKRRVNKLWQENGDSQFKNLTGPNPLLTALYAVSDVVDDTTLDELIALAKE